MNSFAISSSSRSSTLVKAGVLILTAATAASANAQVVENKQILLNGWDSQQPDTTRFTALRSGDVSVVTISNLKPLSYQENKNIKPISTTDMLHTIFSSLGVSVSDLEQVIGVKRATVYNWKKGGDIKGDATFKRLQEVFSIAQEISNFSSKPFGRKAKSVILDGKSYIELLTQDNLDRPRIVEHARVLANQNEKGLERSNKPISSMNDINSLSGEVFING